MQLAKVKETPISFGSADYKDMQYPCDDALVIMLLVENYNPHRIFIDNESSTKVLYWTPSKGWESKKNDCG